MFRFGRAMAVSLAASVAASPALAQGAGASGLTIINLAAVALLIVLAGLLFWVNCAGAIAWRTAVKLEASERLLRAGLETARAAALTWEDDGSIAVTPNAKTLLGIDKSGAPAIADILGAFEGSGHSALGSAGCAELHSQGRDFVQTLKLKDKPRFVLVHGKRIASGDAAMDFQGFRDIGGSEKQKCL